METMKRWALMAGMVCVLGGSLAGCGGGGFASAPKNEQMKSFEGHAPSGESLARYQAAMKAAQNGGPRR